MNIQQIKEEYSKVYPHHGMIPPDAWDFAEHIAKLTEKQADDNESKDTRRLNFMIKYRLCLNNDNLPFMWYVMDYAGEQITDNFREPRKAIDQAMLPEYEKIIY
jgi:hypothetical protein